MAKTSGATGRAFQQAAPLLARASEAHRAGALAEAEALYRAALQAAPRHPDALAMLGVLAMQRGAPEQGVALSAAAVKQRPDYHTYFNYGLVLRAAGRLDQAAKAFGAAAAQDRTAPAAPFERADCLARMGCHADAAASFDEVARRAPNDPGPLLHAAALLLAIQRPVEAVARLRQALVRFGGDDRVVRAACDQLAGVTFYAHDPVFQAAIGRYLGLDGEKPRWLGNKLLNLLSLDPALAPLLVAARDGADFATEAGPGGRLAPLFHCQPLRDLMAGDLVPRAAFEGLLIACRRVLCRAVADGQPVAPEASAFLVALAALCHHGEFAWPEAADDTALVGRLAAMVDEALGAPVPDLGADGPTAHAVAALGCYRPLDRLERAAVLAAAEVADCGLRRLLRHAVAAPLRERALRGAVVAITPINDGVSRAVAEQYDENPYPRWFQPPDVASVPFADLTRRKFPHARLSDAALAPRNVLVAGCGSGWHALLAARLYPQAEILAIDLSAANLAHALRAQEESGIGRVTFRQADITELACLGQHFDLIESVGVLHHLRDPVAGWGVLVDMLRPGGLMRIGLYSETGRAHLHAVEAFAAAGGYTNAATDLRRFRADVLALPEDHPARAAVALNREFFALSSLRDLLFHAQEHRFTLPRLAGALSQLGLDFVGFELLAGWLAQQYRQRFPADDAMVDFAKWAAFEADQPLCFAGMYDFWCVKAAG